MTKALHNNVSKMIRLDSMSMQVEVTPKTDTQSQNMSTQDNGMVLYNATTCSESKTKDDCFTIKCRNFNRSRTPSTKSTANFAEKEE